MAGMGNGNGKTRCMKGKWPSVVATAYQRMDEVEGCRGGQPICWPDWSSGRSCRLPRDRSKWAAQLSSPARANILRARAKGSSGVVCMQSALKPVAPIAKGCVYPGRGDDKEAAVGCGPVEGHSTKSGVCPPAGAQGIRSGLVALDSCGPWGPCAGRGHARLHTEPHVKNKSLGLSE